MELSKFSVKNQRSGTGTFLRNGAALNMAVMIRDLPLEPVQNRFDSLRGTGEVKKFGKEVN